MYTNNSNDSVNNNNNNNNLSNNTQISLNMLNTLSLQSDDNLLDNNSNTNLSPSLKKLSLTDISIAEILDLYKNDVDLLKHILAAKTEEDKRKGSEEIRRAEEARLQSKFIDLQIEQSRRSPLLDNVSLGLSPNDWLSQVNSSDLLLSPSFLNNNPPSPSQIQPLSPYALFDIPLADLKLSAPSSPEPNNNNQFNKKFNSNNTRTNSNNTKHSPAVLIEKISLSDDPPTPINTTDCQEDIKQEADNNSSINNFPPLPPYVPVVKDKSSCKRTFSRTRSTRKPSVRVLAKKNRYLQQSNSNTTQQTNPLPPMNDDLADLADLTTIDSIEPENQPGETKAKKGTEGDNSKTEEIKGVEQEKGEDQITGEVEKNGLLNHDRVMEALRAKLKRSSQQSKEQKNSKEEYTAMSPSGILLLDLKNPKKVFPMRARASVVRKPSSFISAHKLKETTTT